jgi:hypothetical protein
MAERRSSGHLTSDQIVGGSNPSGRAIVSLHHNILWSLEQESGPPRTVRLMPRLIVQSTTSRPDVP